jgi:phosphohistidine phosphatase
VHTLYLLRHAKSSWADPTLPDHERPLAPRGRKDAKRVATHLRLLGCEPELVLCSSSARTRETLELVRQALCSATVSFEGRLYAASSDELLARIREVPEVVASVMVIGHNPGLHQLALTLAAAGGELEQLEAKLPTAALATLAVPVEWSRVAPGAAIVSAYVVPSRLRPSEDAQRS